MDLTKREYTMHDHNTLLKEFILHNEGKLKKLQDDAKIAQVAQESTPVQFTQGAGSVLGVLMNFSSVSGSISYVANDV